MVDGTVRERVYCLLAWVELAGMPVDVESWQALTERLSGQAERVTRTAFSPHREHP